MSRIFILIFSLFSFALPQVSRAAKFMGLGDLPGGTVESYSRGISADGRVVVGSSGSLLRTSDEAFRWSIQSGMQPLNGYPDTFSSSLAYSVSADGSVIVGEVNNPGGGAFRWTEADGVVFIGTEHANDVSADGSLVVGHSSIGAGVERSFFWTHSTGVVDLGLPSGTHSVSANAVDSNGLVIVGTTRLSDPLEDDISEAFYWTQSGGFVLLGDLSGGIIQSGGIAISGDGQVVVGHSNSSLGAEPFRWTLSDGMVGLGDLPGGSVNGVAWATNGNGAIVVGQASAGSAHPSGDAAFIWDQANGMRNLQSVFEADYGLDLSGWLLISGRGVSANGRVFTGDGINPRGDVEAWVAVIPEPESWLLALVCSVVGLLTVREPRN